RGAEAAQVLLVQRNHVGQGVQRRVDVVNLLGYQLQAIGRHVVGKQPTVAVVDQASRRRNAAQTDAVALRARLVHVVLRHLQPGEAQAQGADQQRGDEKAPESAPTEQLR